MSPVLRTARLVLAPVGFADAEALSRLRADPRIYASMLGGVLGRAAADRALADEIGFWGSHGVGMFTVREAGALIGLTGLHERDDGRGLALRVAFDPAARGRGLAREAAGRALRFAHDRGIDRAVAVAREDNLASRSLLRAIGMRERECFVRDGVTLVVHASEGQGRRPWTPAKA